MIAITSKYDARKLNVPVGTILDDAGVPAHIAARYEAMKKPLTEDQESRMREQNAKDLEAAKAMRERVANGMLPF